MLCMPCLHLTRADSVSLFGYQHIVLQPWSSAATYVVGPASRPQLACQAAEGLLFKVFTDFARPPMLGG